MLWLANCANSSLNCRKSEKRYQTWYRRPLEGGAAAARREARSPVDRPYCWTLATAILGWAASSMRSSSTPSIVSSDISRSASRPRVVRRSVSTLRAASRASSTRRRGRFFVTAFWVGEFLTPH
jgi:hypothetical protein